MGESCKKKVREEEGETERKKLGEESRLKLSGIRSLFLEMFINLQEKGSWT